MHRSIPGTGNILLDEIQVYKNKKLHNEKVFKARV